MNKESAAGFADQAVASAANILVIFACARVVSVEEFGETSVAIALVTALVMACRGFFGTSIAVISGDDARVRAELKGASGAALGTGLIFGLLLAMYGAATSSFLWITLGLGSPFLFWQDVLRYGAISLSKPMSALRADTARLGISSTAFIVTFSSLPVPPVILVASWPLGAAVSALALSLSLRSAPSPGGLVRLLNDRVWERLSYAFDTVMLQVTTVLYLVILTVSLGNEGLAGLRGAGTLLGPFNTMVAGMSLVMVPRLARSAASLRGMVREIAPFTSAMGAIALLCGSLGIWLPVEWGQAILGATWMLAAVVLPIMGLEYALNAIRTSVSTILKARRAAGRLVVSRLASTVGIISVAVFGPMFGGAEAVAWGMVINATIGLIIVITLLVRYAPDRRLG